MKSFIALTAAALLSSSASAALVTVNIYGEVEFNQVSFGDFGNVNPGDAALISFMVDSDVFMDSGSFPTRGYEIIQSSFTLTLGSVTAGLQNPYPAGMTPYFVLRNNDPAVDGFFLSSGGVDFPNGVSTDVPGGVDPFFGADFSVSYSGDTLDSLDILDALGTYDFTGLGSFYYAVTDGPFDAMGMIFDHMEIVPAPAALAVLVPFG
ncbi:MAG: hypothetical protein KDA22_16920, partial [Phycisphaerales bacterium]|nr:hypothetical protein [Phycisphaerales bacterium]